ncbi:hypothetical protein BV25DRAFT_1921752 [Artomyces pyxidatus]|uniref:Uncharacterized protein n=1 Tax=Artomyces pyxidatus TaxID=48021 RepID=A0ACB8SG91_9AGAM|nr:hypothetical protein BV25DRAFT_1921752 [Artomyces pyxidatus]
MGPSKPQVFTVVTPIPELGPTFVDLGETDRDVLRTRHEQLTFPTATVTPKAGLLPGRMSVTPSPEPMTRDDEVEQDPNLLDKATRVAHDSDHAFVNLHQRRGGKVRIQDAETGMDSSSTKDTARGTGLAVRQTHAHKPAQPTKKLRDVNGLRLTRSVVPIRKTGKATCWYTQAGFTSLSSPPILAPDTVLEEGDLFLNKFRSTELKQDVLQIWILRYDEEGSSEWREIFGSITHPALPEYQLSFQPCHPDNPSWVRPSTFSRHAQNRERQYKIVAGGGTFYL